MVTAIKKYLVHIVIILILFGFSSVFNQKLAGEYEIKAALIGKFCQFVEWSTNSSVQDIETPFRIAVIGKHNFGKLLDDLYDNKKIKSKPIKIIYSVDPKKLLDCDLVFISSSVGSELDNIINYYSDKQVLMISDSKGFAQRGVHINLYSQNDLIRFEINETAVKKSNLQMSHLILKQAKIVNYGEEK